MEDEYEGFETGPFCRHWSDPSECERKCLTCGHACCKHGFGDGSDPECFEDGCQCQLWTEAEEEAEQPTAAQLEFLKSLDKGG
jgi:hypothetical protein